MTKILKQALFKLKSLKPMPYECSSMLHFSISVSDESVKMKQYVHPDVHSELYAFSLTLNISFNSLSKKTNRNSFEISSF